MKLTIASLIIVVAGVMAFGQAPTLQIVTADPNLPSELFYGNVKVKPLRVRPGTNPPQFITIDDSDFFTQQNYIDLQFAGVLRNGGDIGQTPQQLEFRIVLDQCFKSGATNRGSAITE